MYKLSTLWKSRSSVVSVISYLSSYANDLKRHVQAKHTPQKPFKSNECDYSAIHKSHLKRYVATS